MSQESAKNVPTTPQPASATAVIDKGAPVVATGAGLSRSCAYRLNIYVSFIYLVDHSPPYLFVESSMSQVLVDDTAPSQTSAVGPDSSEAQLPEATAGMSSH